jgi:hypothetical protein
MCLVQIKQAQIKFPLSGFWTVWGCFYFFQKILRDFLSSRCTTSVVDT